MEFSRGIKKIVVENNEQQLLKALNGVLVMVPL